MLDYALYWQLEWKSFVTPLPRSMKFQEAFRMKFWENSRVSTLINCQTPLSEATIRDYHRTFEMSMRTILLHLLKTKEKYVSSVGVGNAKV